MRRKFQWFEWDAANTPHVTRHGCSMEEVQDVMQERRYRTFFLGTRTEDGEVRRAYVGHSRICNRRVVAGVPLPNEGFRPIGCWPAEEAALKVYEAALTTVSRKKDQ